MCGLRAAAKTPRTHPGWQVIEPVQELLRLSGSREDGRKALSGACLLHREQPSARTPAVLTLGLEVSFLDPAIVDSLSMEFTVETSSVFCDWDRKPNGVPRLEKHLRSDDFFHTEAHPQARFVSTQISAVDGGGYEVTGDFTLRGVTKTIRFPAQISMDNGAFTAEAKFDIRRTDWGVSYKGAADNLIREEVVLDILLKG